MSGFTLNIHGARGSVPVSGDEYRKYGGATTCFEIEVSDDRRFLIDAGTGLLRLQNSLPTDRPVHFSVVLTHLHWDHCLALPFFGPLFDPRNRFDFYGRAVGGMDIEEAIDRVMRPPWFPVNFRSTPADKRFHHFEPYMTFPVDEDFEVHPILLHHPDGVTGYRIRYNGATLVVATDVEHGVPESDAALRELARDADAIIYDAQYVPDQYEAQKVGWGHSTWEQGVKLAEAAGVKQLILTSHDPSRTDDQVDEIVRLAQGVFPNTIAAAEGMKIQIG
jgi:phosphoribosyl 1,2-cyclic phosphodiesterase